MRRASCWRSGYRRPSRTNFPSPTHRAIGRSPTGTAWSPTSRASAAVTSTSRCPIEDTAVQVCNRLRPWLPVLLALSANSAVYRNADTGYASWRSILWGRWPTAGPPPHLESAADYDETVQRLQDSGAMLDDGMVYWDARPSAKFPTVEVRVADVPATAAETVLLATLTRAAVMTALTEIRCGATEIRIPEPLLRARYWRAARYGLTGYTRRSDAVVRRGCVPGAARARRIRVRHFRTGPNRVRQTATGRSGSAAPGGAAVTSPTSSPRPLRPPCDSAATPTAVARKPRRSAVSNRCPARR